jgi:TolB protein
LGCELGCSRAPRGAPKRPVTLAAPVDQPKRPACLFRKALRLFASPQGPACYETTVFHDNFKPVHSAKGTVMRLTLKMLIVVLSLVLPASGIVLTTWGEETMAAETARQGEAIESSLEIVSVETGQRKVIYRARQHFEAPNWSRDGKYFIFNSRGRIYTLPVEGGEPRLLDTGSATNCNNDHGLSPDGTLLALSHSPQNQSLIYIVPITGGEPRLVTPLGPSYWHGWSPDGKTLAYCAERNGNYDVYTIPVEGGEETRLTDAPGLDDGPDYSPDGKYIYFNSERTGTMQIWRMHTDGSRQEQITFDSYNDWFPHPSPDGQWLVFLSYEPDVQGHPANKDVTLRIMPMKGGEPRVLVSLFGGQGTINVPSWSPDSKQFAFVSYRILE